MKILKYLIQFLFVILFVSFVSSCERDECADHECLNGGMQTIEFGRCSCICPEGYVGSHCDEIVNCTDDPEFCVNGGVCLNGQCDCPEGYVGDSCQFVQDIEGNTYRTVVIGDQEWFASDLRVVSCNVGTPIPLIEENYDWWRADSTTTGAYCWNENEKERQIGNGYGALYNWYVVDMCNVCPSGWHVPTNDEWSILIEHLGGVANAAAKMKANGEAFWPNSTLEATNESGWSALPGGTRMQTGEFINLDIGGHWWSSTLSFENHSRARVLLSTSKFVHPVDNLSGAGMSIRCMKDK